MTVNKYDVLVTKLTTGFPWNTHILDTVVEVIDTHPNGTMYLLAEDAEKTTQRYIGKGDCIVVKGEETE
jgi:hypothetical protein